MAASLTEAATLFHSTLRSSGGARKAAPFSHCCPHLQMSDSQAYLPNVTLCNSCDGHGDTAIAHVLLLRKKETRVNQQYSYILGGRVA